MKFSRRRFARVLAQLAVFSVAVAYVGRAEAGSYLNRASMLLRGGELEASALRARFQDKELAEVTHRLALARLETSRQMLVPKEVERAHPHLLLVMEFYERAAEAATRGNQQDFLVALARAREDARIFVAVLKQAGWELPS